MSSEKVTIIDNAVTRNFVWLASGAGRRCEFFEKQWLDCASKLGLNKAAKECVFEQSDMGECKDMSIAYKRYQRMQEERLKKGRQYQDPPPYDTLPYTKFKNIVF